MTENELARYGQAFKDRAVARLLPPNSAALDVVARDVGVSTHTLQRWRAEALARPVAERVWTAAARLEAVIATAALDETARGAWCREHGVYPQQLQQWRDSATQALAEPEEARASPQQTRHDRRRIKELERELRRKDRALAETAALLVLSKKVPLLNFKWVQSVVSWLAAGVKGGRSPAQRTLDAGCQPRTLAVMADAAH